MAKVDESKKMPRLLSIDLGYSSVKVCRYDEEGVIVYEKFISAVAKLPQVPLEIDDDLMFRLGTDYFCLSTAALKQPKSYLLNLENFEDLKAAYPVWISYLLKRYGGPEMFDHVIIGLSLAFNDKVDELLQYLYETLMIDPGNTYFICLPQGLSCKEAYSELGLNLREPSTKTDQRLLDYLLVDGGFLTIDATAVTGGKAAASSAIGIPKSGVINIAYNTMDYLYKTYEMRVSVKEAATIVDNDGIFQKRGKKYNISDQVEKFTKAYLVNVIKLIEDRFGENLDAGCQGILILGGLAYFFEKYMNDDDMKKEIEKHFPISFIHLPPVDAEFFNCYSYLRIIEKKLGYQLV